MNGAHDDEDDAEMRSPRTPTYTGNSLMDHNPFDASIMISFPSLNLAPMHFVTSGTSLSPSPDSSDITINLPSLLPPSQPLAWVWTCHLCRSRYPLGVTRRCLVDGHFYCSGDNSTTKRNVKRRKRGTSCSSEFDYEGWEAWATWRQNVSSTRAILLRGTGTSSQRYASFETDPDSNSPGGCTLCEYPSQCRHERASRTKARKATTKMTTKDRTSSTPEASTTSNKPSESQLLKSVRAPAPDQKQDPTPSLVITKEQGSPRLSSQATKQLNKPTQQELNKAETSNKTLTGRFYASQANTTPEEKDKISPQLTIAMPKPIFPDIVKKQDQPSSVRKQITTTINETTSQQDMTTGQVDDSDCRDVSMSDKGGDVNQVESPEIHRRRSKKEKVTEWFKRV